MIERDQLSKFVATTLNTHAFKDYCPNGLQVEGKRQINKLVVGVTACQALIDAAIEEQADGILVHHGLFWKGDPQPLVGHKQRRIKALLSQDINLWGYHLPLDCHPELGNNAQLAARLPVKNVTSYPIDGIDDLLWCGQLQPALSVQNLSKLIERKLEHKPLYLGGDQEQLVTKIAWCSGAAHKYIEQAKALGAELFLSGEVSEQTLHLAKELDIHYLACGHHATERYGVQALAEVLSRQFDIETIFIDIPNPV